MIWLIVVFILWIECIWFGRIKAGLELPHTALDRTAHHTTLQHTESVCLLTAAMAKAFSTPNFNPKQAFFIKLLFFFLSLCSLSICRRLCFILLVVKSHSDECVSFFVSFRFGLKYHLTIIIIVGAEKNHKNTNNPLNKFRACVVAFYSFLCVIFIIRCLSARKKMLIPVIFSQRSVHFFLPLHCFRFFFLGFCSGITGIWVILSALCLLSRLCTLKRRGLRFSSHVSNSFTRISFSHCLCMDVFFHMQKKMRSEQKIQY